MATEVVYIDKIDSPEPVRAYSTTRRTRASPLRRDRQGASCLLSDGVPGHGWREMAFRSYTSRTITARQDFEASCSEIRAKGYAVNWGEWRDRVRGIAAPVRDTYGIDCGRCRRLRTSGAADTRADLRADPARRGGREADLGGSRIPAGGRSGATPCVGRYVVPPGRVRACAAGFEPGSFQPRPGAHGAGQFAGVTTCFPCRV